MALSPEQKFLIVEMKKMGIDKETTVTTAIHLRTKEQIRSIWNWIRSSKVIPNGSQILEKVIQIIEEK